MATAEDFTCPFCGFKDNNDYQMLLHVEVFHSENGDSPFAVKDALVASSIDPPAGISLPARPASPPSAPSSSIAPGEYIDCPYHCGERIAAAELQSHTDLHMAENIALEDAEIASETESSADACNDDDAIKNMSDTFSTNLPNAIRNHGPSLTKPSSSNEKRKASSLKELFFGSSTKKGATPHKITSKSSKIKRLGKKELGPYAHEKRMPSWLQRMLEEGAKVTISNQIGPNGALVRVETIANETPGLIPVLARLSAADRSVARAFYCSPEIRHVAKMHKEGGFCGYRNIQMLISYITDAKALGSVHFQNRLPSIIRLQDMIEDAWDKGYNSVGRIETGGIRLTRKYIGTPEAEALFQNLQIPCEVAAYSSQLKDDAYTTLMSAVFSYFEDDGTRHDNHRVFITAKPPIYFQHQGHSMTIVGVEVRTDGAANLVVFDPMFNPSASVKRFIGNTSFRCSHPGKLLKAFRRGQSYLLKYKDFELLKLAETSPESSSDDLSGT